MAQYGYILFDHDGVLVDTEQWYYRATRDKLAELDVELPLQRYLALQVNGATAWSEALHNGYSEAHINSKKAERNELYQHYLRHQDISIGGVAELLAELRSYCRLAIVTTAKQADFDLIHYGVDGVITDNDQRGIVSQMDFVLTNKDYTHSKPHPEPYLAGLQRFGIQARQALVVEDSQRGLGAAVAAGIDCAAVHHPFTASQDFSQATYRLNSLSELLNIVQQE